MADLTQKNDNVTFSSARGKSLVDYFITPHDCLHFCQSFKVDLTTGLLEKYDAYQLLSNRCKAPAHSLLTVSFKYTYIENVDNEVHTTENAQNETRKCTILTMKNVA